MRMARRLSVLTGTVLLFTAATASAQAPPSYGTPITNEQAKKVMAGAEAEAMKNKWPVVITILDSGGNIMMVHRLDNAQFGSVDIAREKAKSAVALPIKAGSHMLGVVCVVSKEPAHFTPWTVRVLTAIADGLGGL